MNPDRLRRHILRDHEVLRSLLDEVGEQASRLARERGDAGASVDRLRSLGQQLLRQFGEHLALEDELLAPTLRGSGSSGRERARRLDAEHREQRELLDYLLARVRDPSRPLAVLADEWASFVELLRSDMAHEEITILESLLLPEMKSVKLLPPGPLTARSLRH